LAGWCLTALSAAQVENREKPSSTGLYGENLFSTNIRVYRGPQRSLSR